jgi:hypothetical protein
MFKIGDFVNYIPFEGAKPEFGRVKGLYDNLNVFVVYHCNNDWNNYTKYTGQRTAISCLVPASFEVKETKNDN